MASWIGGAIDEAQQVARVEVAKARDLVGERHAAAQLAQQQALEFKAKILALGPDMEEEIAGRGRCRVRRAFDRREGM